MYSVLVVLVLFVLVVAWASRPPFGRTGSGGQRKRACWAARLIIAMITIICISSIIIISIDYHQ